MSRRKAPALFVDVDDATDSAAYRACRDHYLKRGVRRALSRIWNAHHALIAETPADFVNQFRRDFHARAWELIMLAYLLRAGAKLERAAAKGPDFKMTLPGVGTVWVECVVPQHGTGEDAPRRYDRSAGGGALGPDEPVILRYASVLTDKIKKIDGYRKARIVGEAEPVLIALNQGAIDMSSLHDADCPLVVRALFGIGEPVVYINPVTRTSRGARPPMPHVKKAKGSLVPTRIFLEPSGASVAGVLFTGASVYDLIPMGARRLKLVHNPNAGAAFPIGVLPVRGEAWVADDLEHAGVFASAGRLSKRRRWPRR